jgi:hypothetical protein
VLCLHAGSDERDCRAPHGIERGKPRARGLRPQHGDHGRVAAIVNGVLVAVLMHTALEHFIEGRHPHPTETRKIGPSAICPASPRR